MSVCVQMFNFGYTCSGYIDVILSKEHTPRSMADPISNTCSLAA